MILAEYVRGVHGDHEQELLEKQGLEVVNQCDSDVGGSAMLQYILPECKVRQERKKMTLKVNTEEILCLWVRFHLGVVGKRQYKRQILWRM